MSEPTQRLSARLWPHWLSVRIWKGEKFVFGPFGSFLAMSIEVSEEAKISRPH